MPINAKSRLQQIAKEAVQMSELMEGREKIETADIINYYDGKVTINAIDRVPTEDGDFFVYTFKEDDTKFAFSGFVLNKIFEALIADYEGDLTELAGDLAKEGLRVELSTGKTKNKRDITNVKVL